MEFTSYIRKPFSVQAVEVTKENISEIARYVGILRGKTTESPYILVDRGLVPNVFKVYPGFWMTKMGDNVRCYSKRVFEAQFMERTNVIDDLMRVLDNGGEEGEEEVQRPDDDGKP